MADAWGKSAVLRQEQGLMQGDPLSFFKFIILMTVIVLGCRDVFSLSEKDYTPVVRTPTWREFSVKKPRKTRKIRFFRV